jgi:hypothetical protein
MIGVDYVQRMARYNRWQNENLYETASQLADEERRRERGAFFGSIHGTLSHLMWADRLWMSRFCSTQRPQGAISESACIPIGTRSRANGSTSMRRSCDGLKISAPFCHGV